MMTRRSFVYLSLALVVDGCTGISKIPSGGDASAKPPPTKYILPPLSFKYSALEPAIDTKTMTIHHSRHHQAYVDNLNKALEASSEWQRPLQSLFDVASKLPLAIRNNGGGHFNHTFFWHILSPSKASGAPSAKLLSAINDKFGSFDSFKEKFTAAAMARFGSGWAWLVKTPSGLAITSTPNQDNPLMDVAEVPGFPLLAVDVWEHAYYLKYQNRRAEYLKNWWSVVNWGEVSRLYEGP